MILPHFDVPRLGGVSPYGLALTVALSLGVVAAVARAARTRGPSGANVQLALGLSALFLGAPAAHLAYALLDASGPVTPASLAAFWSGHSVVGLLALGVVTFAAAVARLDPGGARSQGDAAATGLAVAWPVGRLGCFLVHDHPADPGWHPVRFTGICVPPVSEWTACGDLGLDELLAGLAFLPALGLLAARRAVPGVAAATFATYAALVRFGLDFLRPEATDPRWAWFTTAQWGCVAVLLAAAWAGPRLSGGAASS